MTRIYAQAALLSILEPWQTCPRSSRTSAAPPSCSSTWSTSYGGSGGCNDIETATSPFVTRGKPTAPCSLTGMVASEPRRRSHGAGCQCRRCLSRLEYARRWHERVTRMYRWALAHERAEHAWASASAQRKQAHAIACAWAREIGLADVDARESRKAWAEIHLDEPADLGGTWEWVTA
jgi:hypothetical protein